MNETFDINLMLIRALVDSGNIPGALDALTQLIEKDPQPEAYALKAHLLSTLQDIPALTASVEWLEQNCQDGTLLLGVLNDLQPKIRERVEVLINQIIDDGTTLPLTELDKLVPLADRFATIHFLHGIALAQIANTIHEGKSNSNQYGRFKRQVDLYLI